MTGPLNDRLVVGDDVKAYSKRSTRRQGDVQRDLTGIRDEAATAAGLDRAEWHRLPTGDGELAVPPGEVDQATVVGRYVVELNDRLAVYNADRVPEARIRLRMAMHIGSLQSTADGYAGPALVVLTRLLDSLPVREALEREERTHMAQIVSARVYEQVVLSGLRGFEPASYREVFCDIPAKEFREPAYVHVPRYGAVGDERGGAESPPAGDEHGDAEPEPVGDEEPSARRGRHGKTTLNAALIKNAQVFNDEVRISGDWIIS